MTVEKPKEKFGHLNPATSALFICDIQEKFETSIELFKMVVTNGHSEASGRKGSHLRQMLNVHLK